MRIIDEVLKKYEENYFGVEMERVYFIREKIFKLHNEIFLNRPEISLIEWFKEMMDMSNTIIDDNNQECEFMYIMNLIGELRTSKWSM